MRATDLVEDYLLLWLLLAVGAGIAVPRLAALTRVSTLLLAVMVGSVSLTLSPDRLRALRLRTLAPTVAASAVMPFLGFGVARLLDLPPALAVGFVVLGAVTPELVAPVMTELAGGDTALTTAVLVVVGLGSVAFVPAVVPLLVEARVAPAPIVEQLLLAVVAPMALAVGARARWPTAVGRRDDVYPAISAVMVVLVIGGVTAANAAVLRSGEGLVAVVLGAIALNLVGYALGWAVGFGGTRPERIASLLSVGMRDFAVAAALVVAAGLPAAASLPAVAFGIVEMASSALLARWFARRTDAESAR